MRKRIPIVLFDTVNLEALVKYGTISPRDLELFHRTNSVEEAYEIIIKGLTKHPLAQGPRQIAYTFFKSVHLRRRHTRAVGAHGLRHSRQIISSKSRGFR